MHKRCEIELMCCPCTDHSIETGVPSDLVLKLLGSFLIHCINGCSQVLELKHLILYVHSKCVGITEASPSNTTLQQLLDQHSEN